MTEVRDASLEATHLVEDLAEAKLLLKDVMFAARMEQALSYVAGLMTTRIAEEGLVPVYRWYHGPRHPARMWATWSGSERFSEHSVIFHTDVARFCAFHDALFGISEPGRVEAQSADLFVRYVRDCVPHSDSFRIWNVAHAIIRSAQYATHSPFLNTMVKTCLDLDLYELGTDRYWVNSVLVRREMISFSDEAFIEGRIKFLRAMLARPKLYYRFTELEDSARRNLAAEHDALTAFGDKRLPWVNWPNNLPAFVDTSKLPEV